MSACSDVAKHGRCHFSSSAGRDGFWSTTRPRMKLESVREMSSPLGAGMEPSELERGPSFTRAFLGEPGMDSLVTFLVFRMGESKPFPVSESSDERFVFASRLSTE